MRLIEVVLGKIHNSGRPGELHSGLYILKQEELDLLVQNMSRKLSRIGPGFLVQASGEFKLFFTEMEKIM